MIKNTNRGSETRKIVLVGLDNAGKTSILLSLQGNSNLLSFLTLKPTQGVNIQNIRDRGTSFNLWDLGGQEQYRRDYVEDLERYFNDVNKIIFVIDVQDTKRYEIALDYLKMMVSHIVNNEIQADISIFLHKFDPDLEKNPNYADSKIRSELLDKIKVIFPAKRSYSLFKTSIFTVFQKRPIPL